VLSHDLRQVLVDGPRGFAAVLGIERVHELERRARDRLHVETHLVHVTQALLDRREAREDVLRLLLVRRARQPVGEAHRRLVLRAVDALDHVVGGRVVDVAVNVDAEVSPTALGRP